VFEGLVRVLGRVDVGLDLGPALRGLAQHLGSPDLGRVNPAREDPGGVRTDTEHDPLARPDEPIDGFHQVDLVVGSLPHDDPKTLDRAVTHDRGPNRHPDRHRHQPVR